MRYSTEPEFRKYVKGYGFLSFPQNLVINMEKNKGILQRKQKSASKRVVQKTAAPAGDLIGNKTADKVTSASETKSKEKENERQEI